MSLFLFVMEFGIAIFFVFLLLLVSLFTYLFLKMVLNTTPKICLKSTGNKNLFWCVPHLFDPYLYPRNLTLFQRQRCKPQNKKCHNINDHCGSDFSADLVHRIYVHQHNITHYYIYILIGKKTSRQCLNIHGCHLKTHGETI